MGGSLGGERARRHLAKALGRAEEINHSYVSRILRLTLLAPDIVEAILDGRQPPALTLARLMKPFPAEWKEQRRRLLGA